MPNPKFSEDPKIKKLLANSPKYNEKVKVSKN